MTSKEITVKQYQKALEIVQRFEYQQDKTVRASVTYDAKVSMTVKVPNDWSPEQVIEALKNGGCYDFDIDDGERVKLNEITELILNGNEIKII